MHRRFWKRDNSNEVDERGHCEARQWAAELLVTWKQGNKARGPGRTEPKNAAERIRECVIRDLKDRFETFIALATPEDHRLLRDILMAYDSITGGPGHQDGHVALGSAFQFQIGADRRYLRVPERFLLRVQNYVAALEEVEAAKTAA